MQLPDVDFFTDETFDAALIDLTENAHQEVRPGLRSENIDDFSDTADVFIDDRSIHHPESGAVVRRISFDDQTGVTVPGSDNTESFHEPVIPQNLYIIRNLLADAFFEADDLLFRTDRSAVKQPAGQSQREAVRIPVPPNFHDSMYNMKRAVRNACRIDKLYIKCMQSI